MTVLSFSCPLCGHAFDPAANAGCATCPLSAGCRIVCCPNCGHSTVDPASSRLARWAAAALKGFTARGETAGSAAAGTVALTGAPRGRARVVAIGAAGADATARLRAYGILPGALVEVVQQRPETVLRIERTEVALERELAALVTVAR